jgi:hypothetical protein
VTWVPLADADPVPGDHCAVAELGASFGQDALWIRAVVSQLAGLDVGLWEGEAADAFAHRRGGLVPHLEALAARWDGAGRALAAWAPTLEAARDMAGRARLRAQAADERRAWAQAGLEQAQAKAAAAERAALTAFPTGMPASVADLDAVPWWQRQVDEHEASLASARALLHEARDLYRKGAAQCEAALHAAADDRLENHGGLLADARRTIHHTVQRFPQIKTIAKELGLAAGLLAITASMFTGVGELAVVAFAVGGLATTVDTALAVSGDAKWSTAAWDGFGLLTFGAGRAFASAARGTAAVSAVERSERLASVNSLEGIVAEGVGSSRPLTGAAAQSRLLRLYNEWTGFVPEAAQGLLPEGRNWLKALTFWEEIEIPPPDVLRIGGQASRYAGVSRIFEGATTANDIRGTIASEKEILEGDGQ